ncbi:hypothetical protein CYMTET_24778 [Cymbomonas tetramitiformis]|uniref:Uncharacterized protein n=1 Tax=Cymbomonas tetramitiformis TaxID=36881 RepID=A0AAE0FVD2_9CHLO|nr:hypothetical protein CYMTET_24778 [Cymbomonas tetramitiformis]
MAAPLISLGVLGVASLPSPRQLQVPGVYGLRPSSSLQIAQKLSDFSLNSFRKMLLPRKIFNQDNSKPPSSQPGAEARAQNVVRDLQINIDILEENGRILVLEQAHLMFGANEESSFAREPTPSSATIEGEEKSASRALSEPNWASDERACTQIPLGRVARHGHARIYPSDDVHQVLLSKLVPALQEAFEAEDALFAPLFDLEDSTLAVRPEANKLLFSTLELIVCPASPAGDWLEASATLHPLDGKRALLELARRLLDSGAPFQGTSDLLGVRFKAYTDPSESITDFNAALRSAKRRNTLDDDEVKELFLAALDPGFYAPVVSRLFTHQQRAAVDLLTMQQWVLECYARHVTAGTHTAAYTLSAAAVTADGDTSQLSDLTTIILDVKRQLKVLTDKVNGRGFTPRADKRKIGNGGGGSGVRFAAGDLPTGGNWSQSQGRKRVAFHKGSGDFIPFCQNSTCKKDEARHWHRDCPNGGKHGAGGSFHSFSLGDIENDLLAEQFQTAMDEHDGERFDALCLLAGGKPEMLDGVSACAFGLEPEREDGALHDFLPYCQPATHMGGFTVGGVESGISAVACTHVREDSPPAPPPAAITHVYPDESEASDVGDMMPVDPMHAHEPDLCFADRIARMGGLSITAEGKDLAMRYMHAESETDSCDGDVDASAAGCDPIDGEDAVPQPPASRRGCGAPPWGFGRSSAIAVMVCAFFYVCATAAPLSAATLGEACTPDHTGPGVGGAAEATTSEPVFTSAAPAAIPPRRHGRHRARQGLHNAPIGLYIPVHPPPPPQYWDAPPSPDYSPGPTTDEEEGEDPSHDDRDLSDFFGGSTNDSITASATSIHGTMTVLRAGAGSATAN